MNLSKAAQAAKAMLTMAKQHKIDQEAKLPDYDATMDDDSSIEDPNEEAPLLAAVYLAQGNQGMLTMCNFTLPEFEELWALFSEYMQQNWNKGRGRKSPYTAKDVFFMLLTVLKQGGAWDMMGMCFKISPTVFKKLITNYAMILSEHAYHELVENFEEEWSMEEMLKHKKKRFDNNPWARYATDVRFQQSN